VTVGRVSREGAASVARHDPGGFDTVEHFLAKIMVIDVYGVTCRLIRIPVPRPRLVCHTRDNEPAAACLLALWLPIPFRYSTPKPCNQMIRECDFDLTKASG
jgi:hypothetical protein